MYEIYVIGLGDASDKLGVRTEREFEAGAVLHHDDRGNT